MHAHDDLRLLLNAAGFTVPDRQLTALEAYASWLESEALQAGGIGPAEADRVLDRHILDSLLFSRVWTDLNHTPNSVLDLGSGVGLPGIPLAILHPDIPVILVDRSGRRMRLAERALRVLDVTNVETLQTEFRDPTIPLVSSVVSRASLPPDDLLPHAQGRLAAGGLAVVAGSIRNRVERPGFDAHQVSLDNLGTSRWFLVGTPSISGGGR